ncbi:MAG: flavodoxin domain-containing protein [Tannerellaceae bacterium]|nr:flavodoxin domain-containing protein [Tannerellaceae bacterium]
MKIAIIYASKHGTTEKVARIIKEKLSPYHDITLISLHENKNPNVLRYEKVILGAPIYNHYPHKLMFKFYAINMHRLIHRILGLYICCNQTNKMQQYYQLQIAYPEFLHLCATYQTMLGGEIDFKKLNFWERYKVKQNLEINESVSDIDYKELEVFVERLH